MRQREVVEGPGAETRFKARDIGGRSGGLEFSVADVQYVIYMYYRYAHMYPLCTDVLSCDNDVSLLL